MELTVLPSADDVQALAEDVNEGSVVRERSALVSNGRRSHSDCLGGTGGGAGGCVLVAVTRCDNDVDTGRNKLEV